MNNTKIINLLLILAILFCFNLAKASNLDPKLAEKLKIADSEDTFKCIVLMKEQPNLAKLRQEAAQSYKSKSEKRLYILSAQKELAAQTQKDLWQYLKIEQEKETVKNLRTWWIINGLSLVGNSKVIHKINSYPEVEKIYESQIIPQDFPKPPNKEDIEYDQKFCEWNMVYTQIDKLWSKNILGTGKVLAIIDTGVDWNHPCLHNNWRGGSNSWFDPTPDGTTEPTDFHGHGTSVMGIVCGQWDGAYQVGVAPQALWIAAKASYSQDPQNWDETDVFDCMNWLEDPDGNSGTDDAPDAINNSWGWSYACDTTFESAIESWFSQEIFSSWACGNSSVLGSVSPADNNECSAPHRNAFSVGATCISCDPDQKEEYWAYFWSSGPNHCDGALYPIIAAPGVDIMAPLFNSTIYYPADGTSMASPHCTGAAGLLLEINPSLSVIDLENALIAGAEDLEGDGPDMNTGYGRINLWNSYQLVKSVALSWQELTVFIIGLLIMFLLLCKSSRKIIKSLCHF